MDKGETMSASAICNIMEDCYLEMMSDAKNLHDDLYDARISLCHETIKQNTKSSKIDMSVVSRIFEDTFQDVKDGLLLIERKKGRLEKLREDIEKHIETKKAA